jgi:hypothetical protein
MNQNYFVGRLDFDSHEDIYLLKKHINKNMLQKNLNFSVGEE